MKDSRLWAAVRVRFSLPPSVIVPAFFIQPSVRLPPTACW